MKVGDKYRSTFNNLIFTVIYKMWDSEELEEAYILTYETRRTTHTSGYGHIVHHSKIKNFTKDHVIIKGITR